MNSANASTAADVVLQAEEKSKVATRDQPTTPKSAVRFQKYDAFNAEEFLKKVSNNEKIKNILRSPRRQRSVYTASSPTSTEASQQQQQQLQASVPPSTPPTPASPPQAVTLAAAGPQKPIAAIGLSISARSGPKVTATPNTNMQARKMPAPVALPRSANAGQSHRYSAGYETPHTGRCSIGSGYTRNALATHYQVSPEPSPSTYQLAQKFPQPMPPPPFATGGISMNHRSNIEFENAATSQITGPIAMNNGTIQVRLREGIRIDMTLDKAIRVLNSRSVAAIALSRNASISALIHPNGRILQSGSKIEIVAYDAMKKNNFVRHAKMWYKGVSFTSEACALTYLVDAAGIRTTTDNFSDLTMDSTLAVLYSDTCHGPTYVEEVKEIIKNSTYTCQEGTEVYEINGFRITQSPDGLVKVTRSHSTSLIRASPSNGSATLTTPNIHCTASLGKTSHLFVRRNEKRIHFDGSAFIVRNAGHSAGFNENDLLIVY